MTTIINTEILAREFSATLREWLRPDELAEVVKRNKAETNNYICHSHDFCDANMAMLEAMETVVGIDVDQAMAKEGNEAIQIRCGSWAWDYQSKGITVDNNDEVNEVVQNFIAETTPLMMAWNEAWEIAKRNEFNHL